MCGRLLPMPSRASTLALLRIIWAALLMGEVTFFIVIATVIWPSSRPPGDDQLLKMLFYADVAALLTMVPVGLFLRNSMFNRARQQTQDAGSAMYQTGSIILWAMCEGVVFLGLVGAMLNKGPWPYLIPAIIAAAVQLATFPTASSIDESV